MLDKVLNLLWEIREFDTERHRQHEDMEPSWKKNQPASTLASYISLFVILPSEVYLSILDLVLGPQKLVKRANA